MSASLAQSSRTALHVLRVSSVETLTGDAVTVTFEVPERLEELFVFSPGQHIALARHHDETGELRRSYSVCSPVGGPLRVAIKRLPGGAFSRWVHESLRAGDEVLVMPPSGRFTTDLDPARARHVAAVAAGSGITPVLSILASILDEEPSSRCTLVYGNRSTDSVMFLEELSDLKNRHADRLHLVHVLSREPQEVPIAEGRIDASKLEQLFNGVLSADDIDEWFLCGPFGMVEAVREALQARGVSASAVHRELFSVEGQGAQRETPGAATVPETIDGAAVTVVLDGRRTTLNVPAGDAVLDAALEVRPDAPYACRGGVCGTCRCLVIEGSVEMTHSYALEDDEIAAGVVLACQSHPTSDVVVLDFDAV